MTALPKRRLTANEPSPASHFLDLASMPWEKTKFPGIQMKILCSEPSTGLSTILFKMDPGAEVPLHEHVALEQTYMIEGSLVDDEGACTAGNFVWRPAGNTHVARAPEGAVFISFFLKPNHFAEGQRFFTE